MKHDKIIASPRFKKSLDILFNDPPNSIGLAGERGNGKGYAACYIAAQILSVPIPKLAVHPYVFHHNAGEIGIEEIRKLQTNLQLSVPGSGAIRRIVIIEHFQLLGHEAQNALLKTLEEPPFNTMIILTIDNPEMILSTIISRLQLFDVSPVSYEAASEQLNTYSDLQLKKAYSISSGSIGLMCSLLEGDTEHELIRAIEYSKDILKMPKFRRIGMVDSITKNRQLQVATVLDGTARLLHAMLKQTVSSGSASKPTITQANDRLRLVLEAIGDIQKGAGQKLVLTRLFLAL